MSQLFDTPVVEKRSLDAIPHAPDRSEPVGFLLRLSKALHTYGLPAYELESTLNACSQALGYGLQCVSSPTSISMTILPPQGAAPQTYVIRVAPGEINLHKLYRITQVAQQVISGELSSESGAKQLKQITQSESIYPLTVTLIAFGVVSASIARIFSGSLIDVLCAGIIGFVVGGLAVVSKNRPFLSHLLPSIGAFLATLLASLLDHFLAQDIVVSVAVISGLIILLPGLSLTIAMAELATQNMVSGTARLAGAATVFVQLAFGSAIAFEVVNYLGLDFRGGVVSPVSLWSICLAVGIAAVAMLPLFEARKKDIGLFWLAAFTAFLTVFFSSQYLGASLGAFCGAIAVGLVAKLVTHLWGLPGAIIIMPGFIVLVPGTIGYKSVLAMLEHDILVGLQTAFDVSIIGISLVAGFLISSMVPLPKNTTSDHY